MYFMVSHLVFGQKFVNLWFNSNFGMTLYDFFSLRISTLLGMVLATILCPSYVCFEIAIAYTNIVRFDMKCPIYSLLT
jgi:hypothetical protein